MHRDPIPSLDLMPPGHIIHFLPDVHFDFDYDTYHWRDPVWGTVRVETWGHSLEDDDDFSDLFKELLLHSSIRRLIGIEQLTLPEGYHTVINAERFSRWEHITGSAELTSKLIDKWNRSNPDSSISSREKTVYILRTMLSDIAHTVGSHLGDWIEGDATETYHDGSLEAYLHDSGVADVITAHNIPIHEVVLTSIKTQDFVESSAPQLCIDRVDYGTREIHRTNPYFWNGQRKFTIDDFCLAEDADGVLRLAMEDPKRALLFTKSYELLSEEDWAEPLQRLQTSLYTKMVKLILIGVGTGVIRTVVGKSEVAPFDDPSWVPERNRNYRDVLGYTEGTLGAAIDDAHSVYHALPSPKPKLLETIVALDACMQQISTTARDYQKHARHEQVAEFMQAVEAGSLVLSDEIQPRPSTQPCSEPGPIESVTFSFSDDSDAIYLPPRKKRSIDPPIHSNNAMEALSSLTSNQLSSNPQPELWAQLIFNDPRVARAVKETDELINQHWQIIKCRPRLSPSQLREVQKHYLMPLSAAIDYGRFTQIGAREEEEHQRVLSYLREDHGI